MAAGIVRERLFLIELKNLTKSFTIDGGEVHALQDINLTIEDGAIYGIIGMSGAGKSTLVRCINMLERPTSGKVLVNGRDMTALTPAQLRAARREITMIFQQFNLLMQRNCLKNICFPMELDGVPKAQAEKRAMELLELVGLPDKAKAFPAQLSGGQRQALTLLMATLKKPKLLLLDEHTAALDPKTAAKVLALTEKIVTRDNLTTLMITHNMRDALRYGNRLIMLHNGRVIIDVQGEEKQHLEIPDLLAMFEKASGSEMASDRLLLG